MDTPSRNYAAGQERLARDLRALVDDAEALLRHAVRDAGAGYADARSQLEKRLAQTRSQLTDIEKAALDGIGQAGRAADDYVHENPWAAIGAGAGLGLLVGLLLGRR
jgi:ElaB/YqjD/DUF883 family membrane-anchored ribosome-binding protein